MGCVWVGLDRGGVGGGGGGGGGGGWWVEEDGRAFFIERYFYFSLSFFLSFRVNSYTKKTRLKKFPGCFTSNIECR